jgi:hypothetical protein
LAFLAAHARGLSAGGFLPENAFTDKARASTVAQFLKINPSVRSSALADSLSTGSLDPAAGFWMPAAFNGMPKRGFFSASSGLLPEDTVQASVFLGIPEGNATIVLGSYEIVQAPLGLYDSLGTKTGEFSPLDGSALVGVAFRVGKSLWGLHATYFESRIAPKLTAKGATGSFGISFPFGFFNDPNISMGLALSHWGPMASVGSAKKSVPSRIQGSLGYRLNRHLAMNADYLVPVDQTPYLAGSLELKIPFSRMTKTPDAWDSAIPTPEELERFFEERPEHASDPRFGLSFWAGMTTKNKVQETVEKFSFGMRLYMGPFTLDGGAASLGQLGIAPRVSLGIFF